MSLSFSSTHVQSDKCMRVLRPRRFQELATHRELIRSKCLDAVGFCKQGSEIFEKPERITGTN
jgi:hypothetical protein